ncbi:uncharacterized protein LOC129579672 isoform X1 [Sitodiplosis mosellana]|uniref:uncharacterized protein LOC129579672 isoform X1 n=1 Tax=Sitodiplosis mosellana TaxID=263140 RepID=UPI00244400A0|nr:uncharacterized protein LOC129579672 isoform X1 [Sitodiplosis mosellana]
MSSTPSNSGSETLDTSSTQRTPKKKQGNLPASGDSPISNSSSDLGRKIADFNGEIFVEIADPGKQPNLDKLIRFLNAMDSTVGTLEKIRLSIEKTKDLGEKLENTEPIENLGSMTWTPRKNKTKTSSSSVAIYDLLVSVGYYFGVARYEVLRAIKAIHGPISPAKRDRLNRLSTLTILHLNEMNNKRGGILGAIAKINQNYQPRPNLLLSDCEHCPNCIRLSKSENELVGWYRTHGPRGVKYFLDKPPSTSTSGDSANTNPNASMHQLLDMPPGGHNDPNHINTQQQNSSQYLSFPHGTHVTTQVDLNQMQSSVSNSSGVTNAPCMSASEGNNSSMDDVSDSSFVQSNAYSSGYGGY